MGKQRTIYEDSYFNEILNKIVNRSKQFQLFLLDNNNIKYGISYVIELCVN